MKKKNLQVIFTLLSAAFFLVSCATASKEKEEALNSKWNTNYTFVFVHGLSGWGHYDAQNTLFPYWGLASGSILKQLNKQGFNCYDASVAPHGSAWDRACELYAQLTGTITDYGVEHSTRCGHNRFGRDFSKEALIPQWDENHKINLLGHSFGGVTVRLLAHLMAQGSEAEQNVTPQEELSPLFKGGHADWIYSVTALAAPHNGTTAYHIPNNDPDMKTRMQKLMDKANSPKKDGRQDYDYADFDMHIPNADEINRWLTTLSSAYYFSFPCKATRSAPDGSQEPVPEIMENFLQSSSEKIGNFEGTTPDGLILGKEWQENDGLVNVISARAPNHAPSEEFHEDASSVKHLKKGIWYIMPVFHGDHMSLQGGLTVKTDVESFYIKHLNMINSLEE